MKKIFVGFLSLSIVALFSVMAMAWSHGGWWGRPRLGWRRILRATANASAAARRTLGAGALRTPTPMAAAHRMLMGKAPLIPTCTVAVQRTPKEEAGRRPAPTAARPTATPTMVVHTTVAEPTLDTTHPPWLIPTGPGATTAEVGLQQAQPLQERQSA